MRQRKRERVKSRVDRATEFVRYLEREEELEREIDGLDVNDRRIMPEIRAAFDLDVDRVMRSAARNYPDANLRTQQAGFSAEETPGNEPDRVDDSSSDIVSDYDLSDS